jgi:gas vesicle structural protein
VLDHVLDKGIVIDAWVRVSLAGIDLLTVEARVVVASIGTYLTYATAVADVESAPIALYTRARRAPTLEEQLQQVRERMDTEAGLHELEHRAQPQLLDRLQRTGRRPLKWRRQPRKRARSRES